MELPEVYIAIKRHAEENKRRGKGGEGGGWGEEEEEDRFRCSEE